MLELHGVQQVVGVVGKKIVCWPAKQPSLHEVAPLSRAVGAEEGRLSTVGAAAVASLSRPGGRILEAGGSSSLRSSVAGVVLGSPGTLPLMHSMG